jgi:hypothetical protein
MSQHQKLPKRLVGAKSLLLIFAVGFSLALVNYLSPTATRIKQSTPVKAEPYIWPEGCEQKRYSYGDKISPQCMRIEYRLNDEYAERIGAETRKRNYRWDSYRVGNDIIGVYPKVPDIK